MSDNGFKEKRAFVRFPVSIRATFPDPAFAGETISAVTKDISEAGVGLITDKELIPGIKINIRLHLSDSGVKINLKGKVVWTNLIEPKKYRVGIQLEEPDLKPIPLVLKFLKSHQT